MCVSGLDGEVDLGALIRCGFGMIRSARTAAGHAKQRFDLRVGLDKGIAVGGILGSKRRMFDIWGDCVNRAARLEGAATLNAVCLRKTVFKDLTGTYAHKNKAEPVFLKGFPERVDVVDLFPSD